MEMVFYSAGIFFFIFASSMLAGILSALGKIEKHLGSKSKEESAK